MKRLAFLLLLPLLALSSWASVEIVEINGISYELDSYSKTASLRYMLGESIGSIDIPTYVKYNDEIYNVTSIRDYAFQYCTGLTSITIPNSVTSIGHGAFYDCTRLTSITIPNSVTSIGNNAFYNCTGLTSITIPNSVTSIGYKAFYNCTGLTSITIPNSVTSIGNYAFSGCTGLTSITIPNSVTSIGDYAFQNCTRLTSITIPNSVTSIGDYAFSGCTGLTSITIPNSVTSIGSLAFNNCTGLTSITIPNSVTSIGNSAFSSCTGLTSITIPSSVTSIEAGAFRGCTGLTSITIPSSVTSIEAGTFLGCKGLTSVTIPNSVTSIGYNAFDGCKGLTSITIPNSVTRIGDLAFANCTGLTSINVDAGNSVYDSRNNCNAIIKTASNTLIAGCKNTIIPNSVTSIGYGAFDGCTGLTRITIPNSVTSIGNNVFYGCTGLTSVTIPNSVTSIGRSAFYNCTGLTSITIPNSVTSIGISAFSGCGLKGISIPNSVTSIDKSLFENCTGLKDISIPSSITSIEDYAFSGCTGLTSVTIPNSVTRIGADAFKNCTGLKEVHAKRTNPSEYNCSDRAFNNIANISEIPLYVPKGCANAYLQCAPWNKFKIIREMETESDVEGKTFTLESPRGYIGYSSLYLCKTSVANASKFAIVNYEGKNYLYDVTNSAFVIHSTAARAGTTGNILRESKTDLSKAVTGFVWGKTGIDTYPWYLEDDFGNWLQMDSNSPSIVCMNTWKDFQGGNGGNTYNVTIIDTDFDATAAIQILSTYFHPGLAASVTLSQTRVTLTSAGETIQLTATVLPESANDKSVTWSSSNTNVATVSKTGLVTAVANGTATITATTNDGSNKSATCKVTVSNQGHVVGTFHPVSRVSMIVPGKEYMIYNSAWSTGTYSDRWGFVYDNNQIAINGLSVPGSFQTSDNAYLWTFEDAGDGKYYVMNVGSGNYAGTGTTMSDTPVAFTIASFVDCPKKGDDGSRSDDGTRIESENITASDKLFYIYNGEKYWNGNNYWTSGVDGFATWSEAHPYAIYEVQSVGGTDTPVLATGISLSQTTLTLTSVGQRATLTATVTPSNATNKSVTWRSSNTSVATVSNSGLVTAVADGTATITATTTDGSNLVASCNVTVSSSASAEELKGYFRSASGDGYLSYASQDVNLQCGTEKTEATIKVSTSYANRYTIRLNGNYIHLGSTAHFTGNEDVTAFSSPYIYKVEDPTAQTIRAHRANSLSEIYNGGYYVIISYAKKDSQWYMMGSENIVNKYPGLAGLLYSATEPGEDIEFTAYAEHSPIWKFVTNPLDEDILATSITLNHTTATLTSASETVQLTATVLPEGASNKSVTWRSNNTSVATVSETGLVTAVANGTATITATTADGTRLSASCTVTVDIASTSSIPGDVNEDGDVDVADIVAVINYVLAASTDAAGDVNEDGDVDVADIVAVINYVLSYNGTRPFDPAIVSDTRGMNSHSDYSLLSATANAQGITLAMDGGADYTAFQFVLTLPDEADLTDVVADADRLGSHQLMFMEIGEGRYFVLGYDDGNSTITGESGTLLNLFIDNQSGTATISDVVFSTPDAQKHRMQDISVLMATGVGSLSSACSDGNVYDVHGRCVMTEKDYKNHGHTLPAGVYIRNGKKFIIR